MKSTWVAAGLLLVTICQAAKDGNPDPIIATPIPETFTIKNIARGATNDFTVCLNGYKPDATSYRLIPKKDGIPETNLESSTAPNPCLNFANYDIKTWTGSELILDLHALNGDVIIDTTTLKITPFPEFPDEATLKTIRVPDPNDRVNDFMLRISGDMNDMTEINELPNIDPIISDDGKIIYYLMGTNIPTAYTPCATSTVPICDVPLVVVTPDPLPETGPTVDKAILSYGYTTAADDEVSAKITVEATSALPPGTASDGLEVIFSEDGAAPAKLCVFESLTETSCTITWPPSDKTANIRLIGTLSNEIQETNITPITDRNVGITYFEGIVEGNWLMIKGKEDQNYKITKKNIDAAATEEDEDIDVDCGSISISSLCFGYFSTVIPSNKYTITVRNGMGVASNEKDQIESEPEEAIAVISSQDLQIHALPMEWHQNLMEVNTTICFSHETPNEEMIFSHYEMLLINTRGQWLKHKVMEEDDNGDVLCFTPFTINTQELDVTEGVKVVVSQRASDGFSVIASGGSTLF